MISYQNSNVPSIDLHGETSDIGLVLVKEFITDNYKLRNKKIVIIHGIGEGIIKKMVYKELKTNKLVKDFNIDPFNIGTTIVYLNLD